MLDKAAILAAFRMPPLQAIAFLRSKGLTVSDSWREVWKEAHAKAFTVARSAGFDVLGDIRDALTEALKNGTSVKEFTKNLTPVLQSKGWWGKAIDPKTGEITKTYDGQTGKPVEYGSPRRLRLIYEQNMQTAYMTGRHKGMVSATATHPLWQYIAVMDGRTRPAHAVMHLKIFRHDDPVWLVAYPPNGWRCRCRVRPMTAQRAAREGLTTSYAAGYITTIQVPRRDGTTIPVQQVKLPGMDIPFQPDVGWDYNPAR